MTFERIPFAERPEFRSTGNNTISALGVAMRYETRSKKIAGKFFEQFTPGAFAKTLKEATIESHHEHTGPYLASTRNNSLRLHDSPTALAYELDLPDTTAGRDAATLLERGDLAGASIGFRPIPAAVKWTADPSGASLRSIGEAQLFRVDLTTSPAYDSTSAEMALRSFAEERGLELRSVLDAPSLADLIDLRSQEEDPTEESEDDGRDSTVVRPRISWLY